jgi:hypothetical protein
MTLPVVWLPEADAELRQALARYAGIRPELGQRFAEAIVDTMEKIAESPLLFAVVEKDGDGPEYIAFLTDVLSRGRDPHCVDCLLPRTP